MTIYSLLSKSDKILPHAQTGMLEPFHFSCVRNIYLFMLVPSVDESGCIRKQACESNPCNKASNNIAESHACQKSVLIEAQRFEGLFISKKKVTSSVYLKLLVIA